MGEPRLRLLRPQGSFEGEKRGVMRKLLVFLCTCVVAVTGVAGAAWASYRGSNNGELAFGMRDASGNAQIFAALPNGAGMHQLTTGDGFNACAAYSPDEIGRAHV